MIVNLLQKGKSDRADNEDEEGQGIEIRKLGRVYIFIGRDLGTLAGIAQHLRILFDSGQHVL